MQFFLTGATGFLGGRLARQLREAGHEVVALVRDPARATHLAELGVRIAVGDVTNKESMREPMRGADGVYHVAGWYQIGVRDKSAGVAVNIEGTRNVLSLMQELEIPRGVYTSTLAVNSNTHGRVVDETYRFNGTHLSEYDRTKAAAHDLALEFMAKGLPLIIVQPGLIYGPGDLGPSNDALVDYLKRKLPVAPQESGYCWAHVEDTAHAHMLAMERGTIGESYFVCGPTMSLVDMMNVWHRLSGVRPPKITASPTLLMGLSVIMSVVEKMITVPANYSSEYLRVAAGVTYYGSNAKAVRELGWEPWSIDDGMPETVDAAIKNLGLR
jgi:nucleoside-diphosphate-sugar epimerase